VVNASKVLMTGNKVTDKKLHRHSGYPGGLKTMSYERLLQARPERAIEKAVRGMLPGNRLGRAMLKKMKVYRGSEHPHSAQSPKPLDLSKAAAPHDPTQAHTIEEVTGG
jgi:large subunit ribosomal protein L13